MWKIYAGHVANDGLASEEASNSEGLTTKTEASFATFAIKFGIINPKISVGGCSISQGFVFATEFGEIGIVSIVAVENNTFWLHFEKRRLSAQITSEILVSEASGSEISECGNIDR